MKKAIERYYHKSYKKESPLSFHIFDRGIILPATKEPTPWFGGVTKSDGTSIPSTSLGMNNGVGYSVPSVEAKQSLDKVIYIGYFHSCWGHLITDELSMLWFLRKDVAEKMLTGGWKLAYVATFRENQIPQYIEKFLQYLDISLSKCMYIAEPTQFTQVCVPEKSWRSDYENGTSLRVYYREYVETINIIKSKILLPSESSGKIYFTRSKVRNNREIGESGLERVFRKAGYKVYSPERLPIEEQISLVSRCTHFAATEGSVSHHALFCHSGTKVAILTKADYVNGYQVAINEFSNLDVTYITAHHSSHIRQGLEFAGPFYLCVTTDVARFLHLNFFLPYWILPSYWVYRFWYSEFSNKYVRNKPKMRKIISFFQQ